MEYCDLKKDRATGRSKVNSREYKSAETTKLSCRYVCSDAHIAISAVIRVPSANAALFSSTAPAPRLMPLPPALSGFLLHQLLDA